MPLRYPCVRFLPLWAPLLGLLNPAALPAAAQAPLVQRPRLTPAPYSATADLGALLKIPFSRPLNPATVGNVRVQSSGVGPWWPVAAGVADSAVVLLPTQQFSPGATVSVTVPATVQSSTGAAASPYCYQFTTTALGGSGTFTRTSLVVPGRQSMRLAEPCDANNDHRPDLVVVNGDSMTVWLGQASGGYRRVPGGFDAGNNSVAAVRAADLDADGETDLAVRLPGGGLLGFHGNGTGVFTRIQPNLLGFSAVTSSDILLELADLNFDGYPDIVAGNSNSNEVTVYRGSAAGTFRAGPVFTLLSQGTNFICRGLLGDYNEDGRLDLVVSEANSLATVALSDAFGNFNPVFGNLYPRPLSVPAWGAYGLAAADFNHDGHLDLASTTQSTTLAVLLGNGTGQLAHVPGSPFALGPNESKAVAVGDLNADSHPDIVVCTNTATSNNTYQLLVLLGEGDGQFTPALGSPLPLGGLTADLRLVDLDNDGDLDILAPVAFTDSIAIFHNQATAVPTLRTATPGSGTAGSRVSLSGANLSGTTAVTFNGVPAKVFRTNALGTLLEATVPAGATTGPVVVTTRTGAATLPAAFTVLAGPTAARTASASRLVLFPNPARHSAYLQLPAGGSTPPSVRVLDATGRVVRTVPLKPGQGGAELPLAGLPAGLYLVQAGNTTQRLLVE
ncbi:FG-GAP-like repeat-containing protein [Hymenobacter ruricola]|uniref:VCBS repeat-containing protein n=1 Tax=Hymenobacter ruricola TaxID=2791023 RepID=A0ABS0I0W4_9BACT|nr:FG-GAP-like repeat-containing protein [Hymenobacter ruricola]MBF9220587.1 VCBS repeat-containing protein [Hymenobacter ruricola]